jgi:hypothetical protein
MNLSNVTPLMLGLNLNMPLEALAGVDAENAYESLEIYIELQTVLDAQSTYMIRPLESEALQSVSSSNLDLNVEVVAEPILHIDAAFDISSGFHLQTPTFSFERYAFEQHWKHLRRRCPFQDFAARKSASRRRRLGCKPKRGSQIFLLG